MNHLKWMGHSATIFEIQRNLRNDLHTCEVTLVAKGFSVRAHRFVLSSCSDLLRNLLADIPFGQEATIVIPDISGVLLDSVLSFIYLGETSLSSTHLSDFLEAISVLGIKSAISFECNTTTLAGATNTIPLKTLSTIHLPQDDIIDQDNIVTQKIVADNVITEHQPTSRDLEFLDVYNDSQNKITYSIEHMPGSTNGNEFILTENTGAFTLTTESTKIGSVADHDDHEACKIDTDGDGDVDPDGDVDDSNIIEDYSSTGDPLIEIDESAVVSSVNPTTTTTNTISTLTNISIMPGKLKGNIIKLKSDPNTCLQHESLDISDTVENTTDVVSQINATQDGYTYSNHDAALELAVNGVLTERMSLQKAAVKFDVSKTVLWRRVRKNPNYMKSARENPVLTLAYDRIRRGESLKNISRELDIPMSTLHRHKVRLAEQGRLPDYVTFKKRDPLSKNELKVKLSKAVHACVYEGMSQNHAANLFDIPKSTLWRHLQKRVAEAELAQSLESDDVKEEIILS